MTPRAKSQTLWVSEGFARSKRSSPPLPSQGLCTPILSQCRDATDTAGLPPSLLECHQQCWGVSGMIVTLAGIEKALHRAMPPHHSLALGNSHHPYGMEWDPDFSHSFRLSLQ